MTIKELQDYYKTAYRFRKETGISSPTFRNWIKWGYVPFRSQLLIERITQGRFKAEEIKEPNEDE
jgi:hypothetical protein